MLKHQYDDVCHVQAFRQAAHCSFYLQDVGKLTSLVSLILAVEKNCQHELDVSEYSRHAQQPCQFHLSDDIGQLVHLEVLHISSQTFSKIKLPDSMTALCSLRDLQILCGWWIFDDIESLPAIPYSAFQQGHFGGLAALGTVPSTMSGAFLLEELALDYMVDLQNLGAAMSCLISLEVLRIHADNLRALSKFSRAQVKLRSIHVTGCRSLVSICDSLGLLESLQHLVLGQLRVLAKPS